MAHLSDQELIDLKARVISATVTGANVGRANEYLLQLIAEVQEHRSGTPAAPAAKKHVLKVGEMEVKKVEEAPVTSPEPEVSASEPEEAEKASKKSPKKKG